MSLAIGRSDEYIGETKKIAFLPHLKVITFG
jgi:hypothetical protein